jgi:hypothetical protein
MSENQEYYYTRSDLQDKGYIQLQRTINEYAHYMLDKGIFLSLTFWTSFVAMLWLIFIGYVASDGLHWLIAVIMFICGLVTSMTRTPDNRGTQ